MKREGGVERCNTRTGTHTMTREGQECTLTREERDVRTDQGETGIRTN